MAEKANVANVELTKTKSAEQDDLQTANKTSTKPAKVPKVEKDLLPYAVKVAKPNP